MKWRYFMLYGSGRPYEIYRLVDDGKPFHAHREPFGLYLARKSGEWTNHTDDLRGVLNASLSGDFVPEEDEITEEQALAYLEKWRTVGPWPGRPW